MGVKAQTEEIILGSWDFGKGGCMFGVEKRVKSSTFFVPMRSQEICKQLKGKFERLVLSSDLAKLDFGGSTPRDQCVFVCPKHSENTMNSPL